MAKERYKALVIPSTDAIHIATLQQALKMAQNGVTVVLVGESPRYAASRNESDERVHQLVQSLRRDARLFPSVHEGMATALRQAGCGVQIEPASPEIWVARYRRDRRPLYCLLHLSQQARKCTLKLPDTVRDASLWLLETGEIRNAGAGKVVAELPALGCVMVW